MHELTLPASLTDDSATMNNRIKHKQVTGQINHQTADPKANAFVFLFFPNAHFLFFNFIATAHLAHLVLPDTQADPSQNQKSQIFPPTERNF